MSQNLAKKLGADNIQFLGFVKDEKLPKLYAEAQAFKDQMPQRL